MRISVDIRNTIICRYVYNILGCIIFFCLPTLCIAQQTYYYKQSGKVENGIRKAGDQSGQFVTFSKKVCYDSDIDGLYIQNGILEYVSQKGNVKSYRGDSFWGKAHYFVSVDFSRINICLSDGTVYIYEREIPKAGVTSSSKVKAKNQTVINPPVVVNVVVGPGTISNNKTKTQKVICSFCNGTGRNPLCDYPPEFTGKVETYQYCPICKSTKRVHSHGTCPSCQGRGYNLQRAY